MSSDHETDSSVENIKSWEVESSSSVEEFDDYSKALDLFNIKSDQDEEPILYEIQKSKINGSILKRIPILNITSRSISVIPTPMTWRMITPDRF